MKLIDLPANPFGYDTRSRRVTRPAMTTMLFLMLAVMIVMDIVRRRKRAAEMPETDADRGTMVRHAA